MYESELKGPDVPCMKHLRRSAGFGRAQLNTSLAIRSGSQKQRPVRGNDWRRRELRGRAVPAVRHVTWWLDRPQPAPGWGRFAERRTSSGLAARLTAFGPQRLKERAVTSCVGSNDRQNDAAGDAEVLRAKGRENADRCGQGMELAAPGMRLIAVGN
jgi:hypothetical protein